MEKKTLPAGFVEPLALKAGDSSVLINGLPVKVDFRVIAEDRYQQLMTAASAPSLKFYRQQQPAAGREGITADRIKEAYDYHLKECDMNDIEPDDIFVFFEKYIIQSSTPSTSTDAGQLFTREQMEGMKEAVENALYATKRFLTTEASELADHIIHYINESAPAQPVSEGKEEKK